MKFLMAMLVLVLATIGLRASAHEHHPPHKGTLVELGEEFAHLELVLDPATGQLTAYALDGEAEKYVRLKQKDIEIKITGVKDLPSITLKAKASMVSGEKEGDTSEFAAQSDKLNGVKEFDGVVSDVTIKGKQFKDVKFNFPKGNEEPEEKKKDEGGGQMGK
jgi:hypothetical protein